METDFLGIHEGFGPAGVGGGHRREPPRFSFIRNFNSAVAFLEQDVFHAAIHVVQGCLRGETVSDEHSSSRFQPVSAIDAFEANQKCFSFDIWRGMNQYPFHAYQPQNTGFVDSSQHKLNHFSPVNMSSPFVQDCGCPKWP
ncbi:hypothetical protein MUK42_35502 [Musa troglodytarum]|uniref:Uncharacterized protein n=1 Tax=Musa troglodytarum TaxID=320322 RepID=A0A9E7I2L9_9LILI|nr:hypothetical protein MUK42_35502 [Musa troglodytarum]